MPEMTKEEFFCKIPDQIQHANLGLGDLVVVLDLPDEKAVCYRHANQQESYKTYGNSWLEVYNDIAWILSKRAYAIKK